MAENPEKLLTIPAAFDPRIQTENIAFDPLELVECDGCGRNNPPNRLKCLYCAHDLDIAPENIHLLKPALRKLDTWERGINIILAGPRTETNTDLAKLAALLGMEVDEVRAIVDAGVPLPLARVETRRDAELLTGELANNGLSCVLVDDAQLADDKPPVRLSEILFLDASFEFKTFNTRATIEIKTDDLVLIVPGVLRSSRIDSLEKKGRRGKTKLIEETSTLSDEAILDIYSRDDSLGYRINLSGFDFSCLGEDKGLIASENLRRLIALLEARSPHLKLVNTYAAAMPALGFVWMVESRNDLRGLQRSGIGKREFGSVASTSNLNQFTKYSRLQWHLL